MFNVAIFGAGKIGDAIAGLLTLSGRYKVKVCDYDIEQARKVASAWSGASPFLLDLKNEASAAELIKGMDAVISALPFHCNTTVAKIAAAVGVNYFDLTEDVETTKAVSAFASTSSACMMPQCGLAPGFISIAAAHLFKSFEKVDTVKMRVGALPLYPSNRLKYNLTWSTEGLINEYGNPCEVIDNFKRIQVLPLEGLETFSLDGNEYEAFNTSGGLGSLCHTLEGKVRKLDYKSVRYPGHRELMAFLMQDLRFNEDRETLRQVMERSISSTAQDKCLILVEVCGTIKSRLVQKSYASTVYNLHVGHRHLSAIQVTTASGVCAPMDLLLTGKITAKKGIIRTEDISLIDFLKNEFGQYYADDDEQALKGITI
jgi:saccharopine dehydrogenase-like NADP-dependent oxidoreductase